ncbi:MAG TPA: LD-carboxypeptidase [Bacteroidota bacterium]
MHILKPPKLRKGDVIGVAAPSSPPLSQEKIANGVRYLESLGYRVRLGSHVHRTHGYLAGTDEERAADLNAMFRDPDVSAIFVLRGGYGVHRILHRLDYRAAGRRPKVVVGYSDLTALQLALWRKVRLVTFSGPMVAVEMGEAIDPFTEEEFWRILTSTAKAGPLRMPDQQPLRVMRKGKKTGRLVGGNLSLLCALLGTPYSPPWKDTVLVLEEVGEEPYRLDRMFMHLRHAKVLKSISGLALGQFVDCQPKDSSKPSFTLDEVLEQLVRELKVPVVANLPYGHVPKKLTIPWGVRSRLDGAHGKVELLESAVV